LYDRADSAFAKSAADLTVPAEVLAGAEWLHVSGVTPAVGPEASKAALALVEAATQAGVKVSFDGNYRAQLWAAWAGDGPAILKKILSHATLAFINERDVALILGERFASREAALQRAFEVFPQLQWIAATTRTLASVTHQGLQGEMVSRTERYVSNEHELSGVVDRIGAGDAFAAGLLHGLLEQHEPQACLEFAVASAVIKHSIPGDFNLTNLQEVTEAMAGGGLDVRR
jgi:2-dehydro-3-deoxygluconokinase